MQMDDKIPEKTTRKTVAISWLKKSSNSRKMIHKVHVIWCSWSGTTCIGRSKIQQETGASFKF